MTTAHPFTDEFSSEFDIFRRAIPPSSRGWRLTTFFQGVSHDLSGVARFDFTVEMGRDDPDEQPGPGRASFTLDGWSTQRLTVLNPGAPIWLEAEAGDGDTRAWHRIWTGVITDVRREFDWQGGQPHNLVRVDATGPLTALERKKVPPGMAGAYPEQLDGVRVWVLLASLGLPMSSSRPEAGHLVNDELPEHAARWNDTTTTVTGGDLVTFTRTTALPDIHATLWTGRRLEVVVTLTLTRAAVVGVAVAGQWVRLLYLAPGSYAVSGAVELPADEDAPTMGVGVLPIDEDWNTACWSDLDGSDWTELPADRNWTAVATASQSTTITLHTVDVWRSGWDWGSVWLIARDPTENTGQTARDHIEEIGRAARGTLWEQRDGTLQWASQLTRNPATVPSLDLPARYIASGVESTQTLSGLCNSVYVEYGWAGVDADGQLIPRPSVHVDDPISRLMFGGAFETTISGPLRDRQSAVAVAQTVLRASARPRERLSQLTTIPLHQMDEPTVVQLLTVTPGVLLEIEDTPAGFPSTQPGAWQGYLEGWSLSGGSNRAATVTITVSERFESMVMAPATTGDLLRSGR